DIQDAIRKYFPGEEIRVSVSKTDGASEHLNEFRRNPEIKHCIVVGRGVLGFDMPHLRTLVDLSCSLNPEIRNQRYGRITRPHPRRKVKQFYVFTPKDRYNESLIAQYIAYDLFTSAGLENHKKGFQNHTIFAAKQRNARSGKPGQKLVARVPVLPRDPDDL